MVSGGRGTTAQVTVLNAAGQLAGFGVYALIAARFGTSALTDAFFLALAIPTLVIGPVVNAVHSIFTPVLTAARVAAPDEVGAVAGSVLRRTTIAALLATGVCLLLLPFAPRVVAGASPDPVLADRIVTLSLWLLPLVPTQVLAGLLAATCNSDGRFLGPAIAFLLRHALSAAIIAVGAARGIEVLPIAFVAGSVLQVVLLAVETGRLRFTVRWWARMPPGDHGFGRLTLPLLVSTVALQCGAFVLRLFAGRLATGSVTALDYATRVSSAFVELLASGVLVVAMVGWAELVATGERDRLAGQVRRAVTLSIALVSALAIGVVVARQDVVDVAFGHGALRGGTAATAAMLGWLIAAAPAEVVSRLYARLFLAWKDGSGLLWLSAARLASVAVLGLLLTPTLGLRGLGIAEFLSIWSAAILLAWRANTRLAHLDLRLARELGSVAVGAVVATALALLLAPVLTAWPALLRGALLGGLAMTTMLLASWTAGHALRDAITQRTARARHRQPA